MDTHEPDDIEQTIGTAFYSTHGKYCRVAVKHGYDLDALYNAGTGWGDFKRVYLAYAIIKGVKSYDQYLKLFNKIRQPDEVPASRQFFSRFTGIKASQTQRTNDYRRRQSAELAELRALRWIDENMEQAQTYINNRLKSTKTKKTIDNL